MKTLWRIKRKENSSNDIIRLILPSGQPGAVWPLQGIVGNVWRHFDYHSATVPGRDQESAEYFIITRQSPFPHSKDITRMQIVPVLRSLVSVRNLHPVGDKWFVCWKEPKALGGNFIGYVLVK